MSAFLPGTSMEPGFVYVDDGSRDGPRDVAHEVVNAFGIYVPWPRDYELGRARLTVERLEEPSS